MEVNETRNFLLTDILLNIKKLVTGGVVKWAYFQKKVEYPFKKPRRHPSKKFNDQSKQHVHYLINLQRYTRHIPLTVVFVPVACPHLKPSPWQSTWGEGGEGNHLLQYSEFGLLHAFNHFLPVLHTAPITLNSVNNTQIDFLK